uniref:Uncharacterized protein n=1 Tax=Oryza sativa subsp. japonica TaxID=39947 RepID=Q10BJ1_ORYSJ|nr:hypothetical protein LOC_Os03g60140 [Oryza sativa Japonica Group]
MASPPPGAHRAASSSGALAPAAFPAASHFASRAAAPFLRQQPHPGGGGDSDGDNAVEEVDEGDDDEDDEEEEAELADGAPCSSQQRCASTPGIGRAGMNRGNGMRQIEEEQQWQHSHIYNCGNEQYGHASSREDEPSTIPREMRVENGYGVIGRREGGPASSYWDLLRAHLSDPLTWKACGKCGQPITEDSIRPNLALRLAVQAFKREEESAKSLKRRRERLEQCSKLCSFSEMRTNVAMMNQIQLRFLETLAFVSVCPIFVTSKMNFSGQQKDPRTICGTRSSCDSTVSKWMVRNIFFPSFNMIIVDIKHRAYPVPAHQVCGEDLRQCRECEVAIPFSG